MPMIPLTDHTGALGQALASSPGQNRPVEGQLQKIRSRCPAVPLPLLPPLAWWRRSPWRSSSLQTGFA